MVNNQKDEAKRTVPITWLDVAETALASVRRDYFKRSKEPNPLWVWAVEQEQEEKAMAKLSAQERGAITRKINKLETRNADLQKRLDELISRGMVNAINEIGKINRDPQPPWDNARSGETPKQEGRGGIKHDNSKLRFDLIPPEVLSYMAASFTYGAPKYSERNWEEGFDWGRVYAALQRHLNAWWGGETGDVEGMPHLANASACLAMLCAFESRRFYGVQGGVDTRHYGGGGCARDVQQRMTEAAQGAIELYELNRQATLVETAPPTRR